MKYKGFEELPVYQKARHLRKRVYQLVKKLPAYEEYNLKLQMRKAATSVTNNIAEGNVSAKTYPGELWKSNDGLRAGFQPDYGRRGKTWVFGAFEPETGQAFTLCHDRRDSSGYIQLLEGVFEHFPAKEWVLITDN